MEEHPRNSKQAKSNNLIIIVLAVLAVVGIVWFFVARLKNNSSTSTSSNKPQAVFLACEKFDKKTAEKLFNTQLKETSSTMNSVNAGATLTTGCSYSNADDKNKDAALLVSTQIVRNSDDKTAQSSFDAAKKQLSQIKELTPKPSPSGSTQSTPSPSNSPSTDAQDVKDLGDQAIYVSRNGQLTVRKGRYVVRVSVKTAKGFDEDKAKAVAKDLLNSLQ